MVSPVMLCLGLLAAASRVDAYREKTALVECLDAAGVPSLTPDSEEWGIYSSPFNEREAYTPVSIAVPTSSEHIQAAVLCGNEQDVKVTPKAGGHSYASLGLGGENGHLVIQLDQMHKITLDTETNIATVEPGARLGPIALELYNQGNRAISHGTCPG